MKRLILFTIAAMLSASLFQGCYKTHDPEACITTDADSFGLYENINFQSCSQYASNYYWDFGDSSQPSSSYGGDGVNYAYRSVGEYLVTLYAYNKGMSKRSIATKKVYIRNKYLRSVLINSINWKDGNNQDWDENDGPDIYLAYKMSSSDWIKITDVKYNLTKADLPLSLKIQGNLPSGAYSFALIDEDPLNFQQVMIQWNYIYVGSSGELPLSDYNYFYDVVLKMSF